MLNPPEKCILIPKVHLWPITCTDSGFPNAWQVESKKCNLSVRQKIAED